jgi:TP901 family phage tail tape measure protein
MAGFGGTIKLTGEEAYKNALKQITAELGNVSSQMKLVNSVYSKNDTSQEALAKKIATLNDKLQTQRDKVATLEKAYADYKKQIDQQTTEHKELVDQLDKEKAKLTEIGNTLGTSSNEYKAQKEVVDQLSKEVDESDKTLESWNLTLKKTESQLNSAQADVNKTTKELNDLGSQAKKAGEGTTELGDSTKKAADSAEKAKQGFTVFKGVIADLAASAIRKAVEGLKNLASETLNVGKSFEASMSNVGAISGASADDLDKLTKRAEELGATMPVTASQVADGFSYMAMAGWKTEDMLQGIEGILNLSIASGADLAETSDIVTDALTALGYAAKDAGQLADVMAAASSNANTNVGLMGATFQYVAPIAGSLGYSMEDLAVAIGLMANAGIKGEKSGTALRSIFTRLSTDTGGATKAFEELGGKVTNADGTMRSLSDVMNDLRKGFSKLNAEQQTNYAKTIAGQEAMSGLLAIVNASDEDFNKLTAAVKNSTGAAQKMSDTMQNNLQGDMTKLQSKIEGIQIQLYNKLQPALRKAAESFSKLLDKVDWNGLAKFAKDSLGNIINAFNWLIDNKDLVLAAIKGIVAAFVAAKVASFVTSIINAVTALKTMITATQGVNAAMAILNGTLAVNPFALVAGLVVGLGTAFISLANSADKSTEAAKRHLEELQEETEAIQQNKDSYDELVKSQQTAIDQGFTEMEYYSQLADELENLVDANGKVKEGYEGRAQFITTTLANALGLEIEYIDGVVKGYTKIKDEIGKLIEAKKAEIVLNAQEKAYSEAILKRDELTRQLTETQQKYNEKHAEYVKAREEYEALDSMWNYQEKLDAQEKMNRLANESNELLKQKGLQQQTLEEYYHNIAQYETNAALFHQGKYSEMTNVDYQYVENFKSAADQQIAILQENITTQEAQIAILNDMYSRTGDERYKKMAEDMQKIVDDNKTKMDQYVSTTEAGLNQAKVKWSDDLDQMISTITGKKIEFRDAGDGNVQMYIDGVAAGAPKSKEEMAKIVTEAIAQITKKKPEADTAGQNLLDGVNNGIKNRNKQQGVFSSIFNFGTNLLASLKRSLEEKSPSKATQEMGQFLLEGLGIGIEKDQKDVLDTVQDFGQAVINTLNDELGAGIDTNVIQGVQDAIPSDFNTNIRRNTTTALNGAQNGSESLVGQFKEALSQMKIVMDDEEMGRFIDKTVSNIVYN